MHIPAHLQVSTQKEGKNLTPTSSISLALAVAAVRGIEVPHLLGPHPLWLLTQGCIDSF